MTARLICEAYNPSPSSNGAITASGAAGGWVAGTYSFLLVNWYEPTGSEANVDLSGPNRAGFAAWNGIVVSNLNTVTIPFSRATVGPTDVPVIPHHTSVYVQTAATFNPANVATKVAATTTRSAVSITVSDDLSLGTETFNATGARVNILPVVAPVVVTPRQRIVELPTIYWPLSLPNRSAYKRIRFGVTRDALTHSEVSRLLVWEANAVHCILTETDESDANLDAPVLSYEGFFVESTFVHRSYSVGEDGARFFDFVVHKTTASTSIPIT